MQCFQGGVPWCNARSATRHAFFFCRGNLPLRLSSHLSRPIEDNVNANAKVVVEHVGRARCSSVGGTATAAASMILLDGKVYRGVSVFSLPTSLDLLFFYQFSASPLPLLSVAVSAFSSIPCSKCRRGGRGRR